MTKKSINLIPEPNSVWVSCNLDIEIKIDPGSVPKDAEELMAFSECMNEFIVKHGAAWANYVIFDEDGSPVASLEYEFAVDENNC